MGKEGQDQGSPIRAFVTDLQNHMILLIYLQTENGLDHTA